jgi:hypothetical protein
LGFEVPDAALCALDRSVAGGDCNHELPRISLLRRWVNKGKREDGICRISLELSCTHNLD